ncbi:MAG: hypothetical protein M3256_26720, partial [Actinomycetota bacterium]|nr:hypothetical protein [Actinomycetota bacterium]
MLVSVKANPNPSLLDALSRAGASFDVGSSGELQLIRSLSKSSYLSLVCPGKTAPLLREAMDLRVDQVVLDSAEECRRYADVLARVPAKVPQSALLRVNPVRPCVDAGEIMGGLPAQFGIDEERLPEALGAAVSRGLDIAGTHFFLGSQIRSTKAICGNFRAAAETTLAVSHATDLRIRTINFGGGFGIPHQDSDSTLDLVEIAETAESSLNALHRALGRPVAGQVEAGRFIFGDAGVYACRIIEVKESRGIRFVVVDSGMTGFTRPAASWGEDHPIWKLGCDYLAGPALDVEKYVVVGPTCFSGDILGRETYLSRPREDDILIVGNAGAYGSTLSLGK